MNLKVAQRTTGSTVKYLGLHGTTTRYKVRTGTGSLWYQVAGEAIRRTNSQLQVPINATKSRVHAQLRPLNTA